MTTQKQNTITNQAVIDAVTLASAENTLEADQLFDLVRKELKLSFAHVERTIKMVLREQNLILTVAEKTAIINKLIVDGLKLNAPKHFDYLVLVEFTNAIINSDTRLVKRDVTTYLKAHDYTIPKKPVHAELNGFETCLNDILGRENWNTIADDELKKIILTHRVNGVPPIMACLNMLKTNNIKKVFKPVIA